MAADPMVRKVGPLNLPLTIGHIYEYDLYSYWTTIWYSVLNPIIAYGDAI